jgi:hypothetical protein
MTDRTRIAAIRAAVRWACARWSRATWPVERRVLRSPRLAVRPIYLRGVAG